MSIVVLGLALAWGAWADEAGSDGSAILLQIKSAPVERRSEVKRALRADSYLIEPEERRRLSSDERDLLNRELRATLPGLYEQSEMRARGRQPK